MAGPVIWTSFLAGRPRLGLWCKYPNSRYTPIRVSNVDIRSTYAKAQGSSWTASGASSSCFTPEGSIYAMQWLPCISLISFSGSSSVGSFLYIGSPCSSDFVLTLAGSTWLCFRRFLNLKKRNPAPRSTNTASATPTPILAFAPLDNGVARLLCIAAGLLCVVLGLLWKVARICRGADVGVKAVKSVVAHATFTGVAIPVNGKVVMVTV